MKLNKSIYGIAVAALALTSCGDRMDYKEYTAFDHAYIDRNFAYTGGFMTTIYNDIDTDWGVFSGAMLASATDEAEFSHSGNAIEDFYNGAWGPSNPRQIMWNKAWEGITYCNEFIDNWLGLTFDEFKYNKDYEKKMFQYKNYQWECRWARAYFYYSLVRQYGAVPFKVHNQSADIENALPRVSADEIFNFIDAECEAIKDSIVEDYTNLADLQAASAAEAGRATKFSVLALRAQAALYHASPLFNTNNDAELWHKAALACKDLVETCEAAGKKLTPTYANLWAKNYYELSDVYAENLFTRRTAASNSFETNNFPVGYSGGQGGNCPTQDLVDAYDMKNGMSIDEEGSGYDAQNPYKNRDSRLAATIAVNGDAWPVDLANTSYKKLETFVGGYHARPRTSYATSTGYYLKKYCNESQILRSGYSTTSPHGWMIFRLGGAYLNYAEALFQYFKSQGMDNAADATDSEFKKSARVYASMTRQRAGLPQFATGLSNDAFWAKYKKERMVELAFEDHRFYDVRRWKEDGDKFMNIHRMVITTETDSEGNEKLVYTVEPYTRGNGVWQEKWNLFPIPQTEIMKSGNALEQNPGWGK